MNGFIIEEQGSENPRINKLLQHASKGGKGKGYPDFVIQSETDSDFLMVVECKASVKNHKSLTLDQFADYAVDGALLYSSYLAKEFDVIALGVSGQRIDRLLADSFLQLKTYQKPIPFINTLLDLPDYQAKYIYKEETRNQRFEILLEYNKELNQTLHSHKIREADRSLLLSGILIALEHEAFRNSYMLYTTAEQLAEALLSAVIHVLQNASIPNIKIKTLEHSYSFIKTNATLSNDKTLFVRLIKEIDEKVNSFAKTYKFFDIFGEFYIEFLRYANNDKGLGIVLTPKHITELFCALANLTKDSVVFDNCCGTGSFIISAMRNMIEQANHNTTKEQTIKNEQVIGIEYQDSIFPLACSNMIHHGDGKTNIFNDNCFNSKYGEKKDSAGKIIKKGVKIVKYINEKFKPTVGMLNPPFKTDKTDTEEFEFVLNNLEALEPNGLCLAILPMQCAIAQKGTKFFLKERLLREHTLEAVISLPHELFYNSKVGVVACALIVKAHQPHPKNYKTYFGYWIDDGFVKRKNKGRIDCFHKWENIKNQWVASFRNKDSLPKISIKRNVSGRDEWCAEAYMATDYSSLSKDDFIKAVHDYVGFQFLVGIVEEITNNSFYDRQTVLKTNEWKSFLLIDIFDKISRGKRLTEADRIRGDVLYFSASDFNNGLTDSISNPLFIESNAIIYTTFGKAYYVGADFTASDEISIFKHAKLNKYNGMFIATVISQNKYKYSFGRKSFKNKFSKDFISLPVNSNNEIDWDFMEDYIKSLPYSSSI